MGLRNFLERLRGVMGTPERFGQGMTPNEKELEVYLERERKQKIKKVLDHYRKKERKEFLQGNPENSVLTHGASLVDTPSRTGELQRKQKKSLKNHENLLKQKGFFMR